jgi:chromosome segregation ATPase
MQMRSWASRVRNYLSRVESNAGPTSDVRTRVLARAVAETDGLRKQWRRVATELTQASDEWQRLETRGDPASFIERQRLAPTIDQLEREAEALTANILASEAHEAELAALTCEYEQEASAARSMIDRLLEALPQDATIIAAHQQARVAGRLAAQLLTMTHDPAYRREVPDALWTLRVAFEERLKFLERTRLQAQRGSERTAERAARAARRAASVSGSV